MEPASSRRPTATGPHVFAAAFAAESGKRQELRDPSPVCEHAPLHVPIDFLDGASNLAAENAVAEFTDHTGNSKGLEAMPEPEVRNWSELHVDALSLVFTKLGGIEVLMGAGLVCRSWLDAAKLPDLWRSIDMSKHKVLDVMEGNVLCAMAKVAVDRSCGQLETFMGDWFVTDDLLKHMGDRAPSLKKLCLFSCHVSNEGIKETINKLPLLDDLELSFCANIHGECVFETIGKSCTRLMHFRKCEYTYRDHSFADDTSYIDREAMGMATMTNLRSLELVGNKFGNNGLMAILDNCPHIESLDIRHCFNIIIANELLAKLARIKTVRLPDDFMAGYQYPDDYSDVYSDDYAYDDYIMDSDDYDDYCDPLRYLDGVYESELNAEDRMSLKVMRMLLKDSDDDDD